MSRVVCEACGGNGTFTSEVDLDLRICPECKGIGTVDDIQIRTAAALERIAVSLESIRTQLIIGVVTLKQR